MGLFLVTLIFKIYSSLTFNNPDIQRHLWWLSSSHIYISAFYWRQFIIFQNHLTSAYENVSFYKSTESYKVTASWFIFRRFLQFIERIKESAISGTLKSLFSCMVWEFWDVLDILTAIIMTALTVPTPHCACLGYFYNLARDHSLWLTSLDRV